MSIEKNYFIVVPLIFLSACGDDDKDTYGNAPRYEPQIITEWLEVTVDNDIYRYESNYNGYGISSKVGFGIGINSYRAGQGDSDWPLEKPELSLYVSLGGFYLDDGIPEGTIIYLSESDSDIVVDLYFSISKNIQTPAEEDSYIVGKYPYTFAGYSAIIGGDIDDWNENNSGILNINTFAPDPINEPPEDYSFFNNYQMDLRLKNVILYKSHSNEDPTQPTWPESITIPTARICNDATYESTRWCEANLLKYPEL